jgi:hypothetical protein
LFLPTDVTKTRLQLQNEMGRSLGRQPSRGFLGTARGILAEEGISSLYRGLTASILRQSICGGIGVGLYQPLKRAVAVKGDTALIFVILIV